MSTFVLIAGVDYEVEDRGHDTPCWIWLGGISEQGYGRYRVAPNERRLAHRVVYEALHGEIAPDREVHHVCEQRPCVNPAHLEALTSLEHHERHLTTHCRRGHLRTEGNTYIVPATGQRQCLDCRRYPCRICGGPTSFNHRSGRLCAACHRRPTDERDARIIALYNAPLVPRLIAEELNMPPAAVASVIRRLLADGRIAHRRGPRKVAA